MIKYTRIEFVQYLKEVFCMSYKITDACVSCGACVPECPVNCISQGDTIFVIDENVCIECGSCANVCPVGAPVQE
jgi:ferredoxin